MEQLGLPATSSSLSRRVFDRGQDVASVSISEEGNLVFAGPLSCMPTGYHSCDVLCLVQQQCTRAVVCPSRRRVTV